MAAEISLWIGGERPSFANVKSAANRRAGGGPRRRGFHYIDF
jgi:hypothetical protein